MNNQIQYSFFNSVFKMNNHTESHQQCENDFFSGTTVYIYNMQIAHRTRIHIKIGCVRK